MPFCFKKKESVAKAVRRLCCERIDDALETLNKSERLEAVHAVRKEIKKLRSVLRLMRHQISYDTYCKSNGELRDAAGRLTGFRDAQVRLNAFDTLVKEYKRKLPARSLPKIKNGLRQNCRAEAKKLSPLTASLKDALCCSRQQLGALKIQSTGWKAIAPGLKKTYGRGRKAIGIVRKNPSPENFHEWRKRVKDLGYQLRLLCPASPRRLSRRSRKLEKLGDLLGDDHDLFMLRGFISEKFMHAFHADAINQLISSRQKELRSAALKLGARFYHEKPRRFCRRVGDYWKTWRHNGH